MSRETAKGTGFETDTVNHMNRRLGGRGIERRAKFGTKDRGDLSGVFLGGKPVVVECKNHQRMELARWLEEAEVERGNADAEYGIVVHKRRGCGAKTMGQTYVTMTLDTYLAITAGGFDKLEGE